MHSQCCRQSPWHYSVQRRWCPPRRWRPSRSFPKKPRPRVGECTDRDRVCTQRICRRSAAGCCAAYRDRGGSRGRVEAPTATAAVALAVAAPPTAVVLVPIASAACPIAVADRLLVVLAELATELMPKAVPLSMTCELSPHAEPAVKVAPLPVSGAEPFALRPQIDCACAGVVPPAPIATSGRARSTPPSPPE